MKVLAVVVAACFASCQAAYSSYGGGYSGPLASPVVSPNGFLADTPEVAAAKAAHFSEVAKVSSAPAGYAPGPYNGAPSAPAYPSYSAPAAPTYNSAPAYHSAPYQHAGNPYANNPSVTPQGFLADTPDVAAAKAAHFAEVAKTNTNPSYGPEAYDDGSYKPEYENPSYSAPAAPAYPSYSAHTAPAYPSYSAPAAPAYPSYSAPQSYAAPAHSHTGHYAGPLASPVVTPQGFLAETPEVTAAKAAHFAEFAKAGTHGSHHGRYRRSAVLVQTPASTVPLPLTHVAPVAYATAPVYSYAASPYTYSAPYSYLHAPSGYGYSVRTW